MKKYLLVLLVVMAGAGYWGLEKSNMLAGWRNRVESRQMEAESEELLEKAKMSREEKARLARPESEASEGGYVSGGRIGEDGVERVQVQGVLWEWGAEVNSVKVDVGQDTPMEIEVPDEVWVLCQPLVKVDEKTGREMVMSKVYMDYSEDMAGLVSVPRKKLLSVAEPGEEVGMIVMVEKADDSPGSHPGSSGNDPGRMILERLVGFGCTFE